MRPAGPHRQRTRKLLRLLEPSGFRALRRPLPGGTSASGKQGSRFHCPPQQPILDRPAATALQRIIGRLPIDKQASDSARVTEATAQRIPALLKEQVWT